jgi:hypothetical protein
MMAREGARSAGGEAARLQSQCFWGTKAEGTGEFALASPFMRPKPRLDLDMPDAKIARPRRARKWYTEYQAHFFPNIRPSLMDNEQRPSPEVGPLRDLLSSPPPKRPEKRFEALKAFAKRALVAAYCRGLLSARTTQRFIDKFELWSA